MTHSSSRAEFEFDRETKLAAFERSEYRCEQCGKEDDRTDRLQAHHLIAIWFVRETGCLGLEVIKSLCNAEILCHDCHSKRHKEESRRYYAELAPIVLQRYLESILADNHKDDWRQKLQTKGKYAGHD